MLWNTGCLFLHIPKTAGKSLTKALALSLPRPTWGLISRGQLQELSDIPADNLHLIEGRGHENLTHAAKYLKAQYGIELESFKAIVVAVRNPYDLMVSNYFFMRRTYKNNQEKRNFRIANDNSFEDFSEKVDFQNVEKWITLDGKRPTQLFMLRFENLQADYNKLMGLLNLPETELPHLNASEHEHYSKYLTTRSEEAIYAKFRYLFDSGLYEREGG